MRIRRKRIQKRNRQRKNTKHIIFLIVCLLLTGILGTLSFFHFRFTGFMSPLPRHGQLFVTTNEATNEQIKKIITGLQKKALIITDTKVTNDGIVVELESGEEIVFAPNKDINSQIASLQVIVTQLTMEGKRFSKLDLRFDKPVIVLNK